MKKRALNMTTAPNFLEKNKYWLGYGVLLAFLSSFGQTFLISLYLPSIQEAFQLSDVGFSSIYAAATLLSAFSITWLGRFIDKTRLIRFTVLIMAGLVATLLLFSQVYSLFVLFLAIYGLRLFGQGLMSHTSVTSMARFFDQGRGKAIGIAALGHPLGEMLLPIAVVSAIYALGWRYAALLTGGFVAITIPFAIFLLKRKATFAQLRKYIPLTFSEKEASQASILHIMRSKVFWIIMPSLLASASVGTGFLLFKLKLGLTYGWSPNFIAIGFTAYAVGNALANLLGGVMADRYSGKQLFPFYLFAAMGGFVCLAISTQPWVYLVLVAGIGLTNGFGGTVKNVALTELYGVKIIGSVRSLFITVMIFSTAIGPLFFGMLLDAGYSFQQIALAGLLIYLAATLNAWRLVKVPRVA
jgi:MFS family permease